MWIQNTNRKSSKNKRKITIESQYNDTLFNLLQFFGLPYKQGNCHLMGELLRIYFRLYGKLSLSGGMRFSADPEFPVTSGIHHITLFQCFGIILA